MQHEEYTIDFGHPNIIEMSVPFVSKRPKVSDVAIYARVKQVRKKYIKVFGVPYENYVY